MVCRRGRGYCTVRLSLRFAFYHLDSGRRLGQQLSQASPAVCPTANMPRQVGPTPKLDLGLDFPPKKSFKAFHFFRSIQISFSLEIAFFEGVERLDQSKPSYT